MPTRGRHRRYRPAAGLRTSLRVTASGAGIALPLVGAQLAHAGPDTWHKAADSESGNRRDLNAGNAADGGPQFTQSTWAAYRGTAHAPRAERAERARADRSKQQTTYEVVGGDSLSSIAAARDVGGGWQRLYAHNRATVGGDPDLILPGQRLQLDGTAPQSTPRIQHGTGAPHRKNGTAAKTAKPAKAPKAASPARKPEAPAVIAPVSGYRPSTPYGAGGGSWSSGHHTGVDFPVPTGTTVRAVSSGRVVSAGWAGAYGYEVVLRHRDGKFSQYGHLSAISVRAGQTLGPGRRIGRSGATGNATGPHLHFEIRNGPGYGTDIDPLGYLRRHGVTL